MDTQLREESPPKTHPAGEPQEHSHDATHQDNNNTNTNTNTTTHQESSNGTLQEAPDKPAEVVQKEGFLFRKVHTGPITSWKKRWCCLKEGLLTLSPKQPEPEHSPRKRRSLSSPKALVRSLSVASVTVINLQKATELGSVENGHVHHAQHQQLYEFRIVTSNHAYVLGAFSAEDKDAWLSVLRSHVPSSGTSLQIGNLSTTTAHKKLDTFKSTDPLPSPKKKLTPRRGTLQSEDSALAEKQPSLLPSDVNEKHGSDEDDEEGEEDFIEETRDGEKKKEKIERGVKIAGDTGAPKVPVIVVPRASETAPPSPTAEQQQQQQQQPTSTTTTTTTTTTPAITATTTQQQPKQPDQPATLPSEDTTTTVGSMFNKMSALYALVVTSVGLSQEHTGFVIMALVLGYFVGCFDLHPLMLLLFAVVVDKIGTTVQAPEKRKVCIDKLNSLVTKK